MANPLLSRRGDSRAGFRRRRYQPVSEINVTPFVDVMLVLLIVFMVTAPLLTVGIPLELPKAGAPPVTNPQEPLVLSIQADGRVYLQESEVALGEIVPRLIAATAGKADSRIFVRGDRRLAYGRVVEVMGLLTSAGFTKVALVAETLDGR